MIDLGFVYQFVKILFYVFIAFICKTLYQFVYLPWKARKRYSKYKNVAMADKFYPFQGDLAIWNQNDARGNGKFQHFIDEALSEKGYDIRLTQLGPESVIDVCSVKALDEFEKLVPSKIDRYHHRGLPIGYFLKGSLAVTRSTENWSIRRKEMIKKLAINNCSKYIPMMIEIVDKNIQNTPTNHEIDIIQFFSRITIEAVTKIFFGQSITEKMKEIAYICPKTGKKSTKKFHEFYPQIISNEFEAFIDPKGKLFSFLVEYKLVEPYITNAKNLEACYNALAEYLETSLDKDSVYFLLYSSKQYTKHECIMDALMMIFGGFDTSAHSLASMVRLLKRNPDKYDKLMKELDRYQITKLDKVPKDEYKTIFEECDYLSFVTKEAMRLDGPTIETPLYQAIEECDIAGVRIPKGQCVSISVYHPHYDSKQWQRPEEFIPERFDPESDLFFKPGTTEMRHRKSFIPFSFGSRNCLGQTLARLELKVLLSRFLTKVDYEISKKDLENNFKYSVYDVRGMNGTITATKY